MHTQNVNVKTAARETAGRWGLKPSKPNLMDLPLPAMRGLEIRIAWGKARAGRVTDEAKASDEMSAVLTDVKDLGCDEYWDGEKEAPGMFANEPQLIAAWREGWETAASIDESRIEEEEYEMREKRQKTPKMQFPYKIMLSEYKKNAPGEEGDFLEFHTLKELQNYRKRNPEKMSEQYFYALTNTSINFTYVHAAEGKHYKQFVKGIKKAGLENVFGGDPETDILYSW
ncbi:hypothetical protein [Enterobacter hormaechei]|uniref:hypothetical protein n=1 Tax=Enterobacter hormaechei TaxID=158836 RepID=UPI0026F1A33D|nr:hypothetical protein [Enterobacter hormaechei]